MMNKLILAMFLVCARSFLIALQIILVIESQSRASSRSSQHKRKRNRNAPPKYLILNKISERLAFIQRITQESNRECFKNFRMSSEAFSKICGLLRGDHGLKDDRYISVPERQTLAHHQKNRVLQTDFQRSGQAISHIFHQVLRAVLKMRGRLLVPPVPVDFTCPDKRWKSFQGCIGALDGTYIPAHVPIVDQPRYRTRKGNLTTNVLGVCDTQGRFIYVLAGWEGSAADARVLRDAIARQNGLVVQNGTTLIGCCRLGLVAVEN